jgi:hypothetical protein
MVRKERVNERRGMTPNNVKCGTYIKQSPKFHSSVGKKQGTKGAATHSPCSYHSATKGRKRGNVRRWSVRTVRPPLYAAVRLLQQHPPHGRHDGPRWCLRLHKPNIHFFPSWGSCFVPPDKKH